MAAPIEVQLRNAQSSLLFMQQEHAHTLQALHAELQKLQKKCSELTFELAMKSDDIDEEQHKEEQQKLQDELSATNELNSVLQEQIEKKDRRITSLEQQLKAQEKKFQDELKLKKQKISSLSNELDQRSTNIAYLTTQLHQLSRLKQKERDLGNIENTRVGSPLPPKDPPPKFRRRPVRSPSVDSAKALDSRFLEMSHASERHTSDLGASLPSKPQSPAFDVTAYVAKVDTEKANVKIKPAPPILPPISTLPQDSRTVFSTSTMSPSRGQFYTRKGVRFSQRRESEPVEVNSLAFKAVHQRKKDVNTAQSNSDSS